ncbi:MAG: FxsA family protein [Acidobacteria bacterium]|nr:MAG: FxsA family protein [Acidobacteriota bacterium]
MLFRLLLLFTLLPLAELWLLLEIGRVVGPLATVVLVLSTGLLGALLARRQGLGILARLRAETAAGRMPAAALLDGLLILVAGAVLITPGLITDLIGFALLLPAGRRAVRRLLARRLRASFAAGTRGASPAAAPRVIVIEPEEDP